MFLKATVLDTFENQGLAEDLWGNHLDGDTWSCIYLVGNVGPVSIPVLDFNITVGYKANAINQQFRVLNQPPSDRFFQDFDPDAGNEELRTVVRFIHSDPDRHGQAVARRELGMLRDTLLNNRVVAPCGICGHVCPPELLVAAHIKPRAKCTLTEKLDIPDVAMLMCTLGCDALYEKGCVVVHDGSVVACGLANDPIEIVRRLQTLHGRNCPGWNAGRSKYFRWHEANVGRQ